MRDKLAILLIGAVFIPCLLAVALRGLILELWHWPAQKRFEKLGAIPRARPTIVLWLRGATVESIVNGRPGGAIHAGDGHPITKLQLRRQFEPRYDVVFFP